MSTKTGIRSGIAFRPPVRTDGAQIRELVGRCPPLDVNSTYAYLLLCTHFADTCVAAEAEADGVMVGFLSAYRMPSHHERLFVWQVAVAPEQRGAGLARLMLNELLDRPAVRDCSMLQTTVSPDNKASRRLFESVARERGAVITESNGFSCADFGAESHEEESLLSFPLQPVVSSVVL